MLWVSVCDTTTRQSVWDTRREREREREEEREEEESSRTHTRTRGGAGEVGGRAGEKQDGRVGEGEFGKRDMDIERGEGWENENVRYKVQVGRDFIVNHLVEWWVGE